MRMEVINNSEVRINPVNPVKVGEMMILPGVTTIRNIINEMIRNGLSIKNCVIAFMGQDENGSEASVWFFGVFGRYIYSSLSFNDIQMIDNYMLNRVILFNVDIISGHADLASWLAYFFGHQIGSFERDIPILKIKY